MLFSQWAMKIIEIIIVPTVVITVFVCFIVALLQVRKVRNMTEQLERAQQSQVSSNSQQAALQDQIKLSEEQCHNLKVDQGKLQTQLHGAIDTSTRFYNDLETSKDTVLALQIKIDEANQQHHETARRLDIARAEGRGVQEHFTEMRVRLTSSERKNESMQTERDNLMADIASEGKRANSLETSEREVREQLAESKQTIALQIESFNQMQERLYKLSSEHTELRTTLQKREEHFQDQMDQLYDTKKSLTQEFENLANKIFEDKSKTFTNTSQISIDGLLKPFREQIEVFQKRINDVHDASQHGNTSLNGEIKKVLDIGLKMSVEANNLTSALKGDSQQRGAWGEAQLRRTLEMSGLIEEAHFEVQSSFKDAVGRIKQTDYLVKIPDGKHIIIDSKVSLNAYDRAVGAESPEAYQFAIADHIKSVRRHIDDLASKDYTNLVGMRSPSFVLMFMPIEPAYIEAMKNNKDLFEYGYRKGIVLVSHTTLIPILRTVSNLWMIERSNSEAREISEKAGEIYNQVCTVAERLYKLGGSLNTVSNHYNETVKALSGKQGLYGKVDRFNKLSSKVSKTLPPLEPTHMDFESERLSLIVEAIDEYIEETEPRPILEKQLP